MSFSLGAHPLLLLACALSAAGLTFWTYRRTVPQLAGGKRWLLSGLRFAALFLILFLLFDPIVRRIERQSRPPVLAVLVDDSQSLSLAGAGADTAASGDAARQMLARLPVGDVPGDVRIYRFSSVAEEIQAEGSSWTDSLTFSGQRTDIARALDFVREDLKEENLKSVLLVSDGQYNTGRNPLYLAERYPVPIQAAVVGDTTTRRDVQIRNVITNEIAYAGTEQPVQVRLRTTNVDGSRLNVTLSQGGRTLQTQAVDVPAGTAEFPVDLTFVPEREGLQQLTVGVTRLPGEVTYRNNSAMVNARVLKSKKRVLLVSAAPDPDLSAIRQVLQANPDVEITPLVQKAAGEFYDAAPLARIKEHDAIVLAGFPGAAARPDQIRPIAEAARTGTPLFFLLSRQTDLNLLQQHFGDILPVQPEAIRRGFYDALFVPAPAATRHPILNASNTEQELWQRLPPLQYNDTRWRVSPDARVLATVQVRGVALDDPMLVVRQRGALRSGALLAAGTWRWRNVPEDLSAIADFWPRLLSNTVQWVTTRDDDRPVRVRPVEEVFAGGEPVQLTGQVYDESLRPIDDAVLEVQIVAPDGQQYPYRMESVGNGRYVLDAGAMPEGAYRFTAVAERGDTRIGADEGTFAIGSLNVEFRETQANTALMRQLALRSGGRLVTPEQLGNLPALLRASGSFTATVQELDESAEVRRFYVLALVIIALLSAEWVIRKRSGLA